MDVQERACSRRYSRAFRLSDRLQVLLLLHLALQAAAHLADYLVLTGDHLRQTHADVARLYAPPGGVSGVVGHLSRSIMVLVGVQPVFTQVPPKCSYSMRAAVQPWSA